MALDTRALADLAAHDDFISRHNGPRSEDVAAMLAVLGEHDFAGLLDKTIPADIRLGRELALEAPKGERETLSYLKSLAKRNKVFKSYIGMGYYDTLMPAVITRNVLENPGWYTAYTPYQPEISQGRLEALLNFQQVIIDFTGMELANASLLDEATAAAEAMALCARANKKARSCNAFFAASDLLPQTLDVLRTRAAYLGFELIIDRPERIQEHQVFGALFGYPAEQGEIHDLRALIELAHAQEAMACVSADLMSLALLEAPGRFKADVVLGNSQRFGVPMGFGGPHAAYFAVSDALKRSIPGRVIGVSRDSQGNQALRMAMQTREQHIRREKATSNICTAQALLANLAGFYAVYHGAEGITRIASRIHRLTHLLAEGLAAKGVTRVNRHYFDTLTVEGLEVEAVRGRALAAGINLRYREDRRIGISLDETTTAQDLQALFDVLLGAEHGLGVAELDRLHRDGHGLPIQALRQSEFLTHPTFKRYRSETEMLRYLKRLENKDLSLAHAMIPLGSCTMKLNATTEMIPVTWPEFADIHPFAPRDQVSGYLQLIDELSHALLEVTGYDALSMQPNSGAQGEYAGLVAIRRYQAAQDQGHRDVCLIPSSAHGTNPASAAMAQMKVVVVECDSLGNIDIDDLRAKAEQHAERLSAIMLTYPSTHGVFEARVREACEIVHAQGGQVYIDGANMNAQVGLCRPGDFGGDVSHLNLHKTFCIPHGGGGPGMGPIGVKAHLAPYLPNHAVTPLEGIEPDSHAVSAAAYGSASILPISWAYIKMMGARGLREATELAILNANYIAKRLDGHFEVLYKGESGRVAHECIIDVRPLKAISGVSEEDIAKRLIDYGFHAPTMSFPVAGTLMIEPTESESRYELDRFCDAMIAIREEISRVESGEWPRDDNPLVNAPHTQRDLSGEWSHPYSRDTACFPSAATRMAKFWPAVNRVDNVFGDRNLVCSCAPIDAYRD
ncbi:aminomethyl-transferring glycine dehydrogenase [Halotalea alkalilenta]|uniref:Glycine dehydrogenase (decarboxylating) n=1 Tax=Halotalea alkalilenta TaxID=376489 RepID=A0A172YGB4_9GAMM|nr:aminomethyl-transferring glycine dehydrogenase [Halotalea alkalilenta]ANF58263.1 glycine dehydrogenase (aminomethyl-transferring) [Halotalea alkalilenta]